MARKKFVSNPENDLLELAVIQALMRLDVGETLPYMQLDNMARGKRWLLDRARRKVQHQHGYVFATIRSVGIKRLERENIDGVGVYARRQAIRKFTRVLDTLSKALKCDGANMDRGTKLRITAEMSRQGLCIEIAKD